MFDLIMDGFNDHLIDQKLNTMVAPYIAEVGLSVSMEPSLMYAYTSDDKHFYIDTEQEKEEPNNQPLDFHCNDRAKGVDKLQKRLIHLIEDTFSSNR